ncbi:hypothetical protein QQX98_003167 [Neonectria punicea]|uniref:Uncharacterized protein n=1 Tax=Neonectria punicea TaxID=979145 RepID=A0ABR1HG26_9HYPO
MNVTQPKRKFRDNAKSPKIGNPNYMSPDAVAKRIKRLDELWGEGRWLPPATWFPEGCDIREELSDSDISNLLEISLKAHGNEKDFLYLGLLYMPGPAGVLYKHACRSDAHPEEPCRPKWTSITSINALREMRSLPSSKDPKSNWSASGSPPLRRTPSPSSPCNNQSQPKARKGSREGPANDLTVTSSVPATGLQTPVQSPGGVRPDHRKSASKGNMREHGLLALEAHNQLTSDKLLTPDVVRFLQDCFSESAPTADVTFLDPEHFNMSTCTDIAKRFDRSHSQELFNKVRRSRHTFSAIFHPWGHGCWTFLRIRPDESTRRMNVDHYDPAAREQAVKRGHLVEETLASWVTTSFQGWTMKWHIMDGPHHKDNIQSGAFVVLAWSELLSKGRLPVDDWAFEDPRAHVRHSLLHPLARKQSNASSQTLDRQPCTNGGNDEHLNPGGKDAFLPPWDGWNGGEAHGPVRSSTQEPTGSKRPRSNSSALPPQTEESDPPTKKICQDNPPVYASDMLQQMMPLCEELAAMIDLKSPSVNATASKAAVQEHEMNIGLLENLLVAQNRTHAEAERKHEIAQVRKAIIAQYRDEMLGTNGRDLPQDNELVQKYEGEAVGAREAIRTDLEEFLATKVKEKTEMVGATSDAMRQAAVEAERRRREVDECRQVLAEKKDEMADMVRCKMIEGPIKALMQAAKEVSTVNAANASEHFRAVFGRE